jgi:Kef-type K+ transport system membrane component KefB
VLTLSAIASATAPAATLMVIKQYKARGPLVDTLLPVVALDDAAALVLFAVLFSAAKSVAGSSAFSFYETLVKPLLSIIISLAIGALFGLIVSLASRFFKSRANSTIWIILSICACAGLYHLFQQPYMGSFELSSLLMCMMAGAFYVNLRKDALATLEVIERITPVIFILFFVLSGADLNLSIFAGDAVLFLLFAAGFYLVFRVLGKWGGAYLGATLTHCEPQVRKYLGIALIPQAGVAIGLATSAGKSLAVINPEVGGMITAIILTSTIVYELVGPALTKMALSKAGEIPARG